MARSDGGQPIVVIGGGAACALLLHRLAAAVAAGGGRARPVVVVEPSPRLGPGVAYTTADPLHLMNVRRVRLSADGEHGDDLCQWLTEHRLPTDPDGYLQRRWYGDYLVDVTERAAEVLDVDHRRARAVAVRRHSDRWRVSLGDGRSVVASDVVLATGMPSRARSRFEALGRTMSIVTDPWAQGALDRPHHRRVLVVGTGLTMVDVALSLVDRNPDVEVVATSRRGLVPRSSERRPGAALDPSLLPAPGVRARTLVQRVVSLGRHHPGGWQAVVDGVRPVANELWRALEPGDQALLLRRWWPWWNVHRHRTAPTVGQALSGLLASGQLRVRRGAVVALEPANGRVAVHLGRGEPDERVTVDVVIDATGPSESLVEARDPLLRDLVGSGAVSVERHGIGLSVDRAGRPSAPCGAATPGLWVIGALRRGSEWETTAIPELREQAVTVARHLMLDSEARSPLAVARA